MDRKDLLPFLKGSGEKPTIDCPHCFAQISHVEMAKERHGVMYIGGEILYDLNSDNNWAPDTSARMSEEVEEVDMALVPELAGL